MAKLLAKPKLDKQLELEQAIAFSELGDRLFDELSDRISTKRQYRLLFEHKLKPELFQQIQIAAAGYISACLNSPIILSEEEMLQRLLEQRNTLSNYTGTGLLMPKREHTLAFNLFQRSVAEAFYQLGANDLIDAVDLPVNLRMVYGKTDPEKTRLPFASSKLHSDVWAGVPADATVVILPLFGDIENITIEAGEMPREMELKAMRIMSDFDEGRDIPMVVSYTEAQLQHGTMYFNDARGLHQTVRRQTDGVRISVDFRFRRKFNKAYRAMLSPSLGGVEQDMSVPYEEWLKVGKETLIIFDETIEEAKFKRNSSSSVPLYMRGYRLLKMFD
ncbi:hypothetical protein [Fischerella thermalis]|uniref:hypothetical protein n=1 Tax=Fischerella thermalis TaxID=372787 RepID=UPI000C80B674|nr:hypothetical protein [Fischerella thermalis]PLZ28736.1 hypothetical protein CBP29_01490 [Fischerella thermalis WC341]PLZ29409.1 hypothetical protein CBP10_15405 [Fischerella thermalis WC558]PLZ33661.1 hypothetical protein CBP28_03120 [Fischerella thermalis WC559]PLZ33821.1 hypothetical protein CBP27_16505 [Fischerella thermalis WC542]PLZ62594.1 hypothetical protein CBP24_01710 [Fischerella thermalis WC439]